MLRSVPGDFRVSELLDLEFDDHGEHDWLRIEKTDVNTAWLARRLADFAGIPARDVGYAGLKDRHAVTRQWFSVRRPGGGGADWSALRLPGVSVLDTARHGRKLKRGAHRGNAFELRLRDVDGDVLPRLAHIARHGVPNYFGEQRFGHAAGNLLLAEALIAGRRLKRDKRSIGLSAARSFLFNCVLDQRIGDETWNCLRQGDVVNLDGSNSVFDLATVDASAARRCKELDIHPSGPLWGRGRDAPGQRLLPAELDAVKAHAKLCAGLERLADAGRRALRVRVRDLEWELDGTTLSLSFALGRGSYATAVLREFVAYRQPDVQRARSNT